MLEVSHVCFRAVVGRVGPEGSFQCSYSDIMGVVMVGGRIYVSVEGVGLMEARFNEAALVSEFYRFMHSFRQ